MIFVCKNVNQAQEEFTEIEEYRFKKDSRFKYLESIINKDNGITT